jgi:hypothetical protein
MHAFDTVDGPMAFVFNRAPLSFSRGPQNTSSATRKSTIQVESNDKKLLAFRKQ